jgi:hypothetical protein
VLGVGAAFAGHGLIQILKRVGDKAEPLKPPVPPAPPTQSTRPEGRSDG